MLRKTPQFPVNMPEAGKRLRQLIRVQHDSVGHFADRIGVARNTLYRFTTNGKIPSVPTLLAICRRLGCSVEFLLGLETPETNARDAYMTAVLNIQAFGAQWKQEDRLALAAAAAGLLTEAQENKLVVRFRQ